MLSVQEEKRDGHKDTLNQNNLYIFSQSLRMCPLAGDATKDQILFPDNPAFRA